MPSTPSLRVATPHDVEELLELMMVSSWGGIRSAWARVTAPGESWRQRGVAELADASCEIGYPRFVVADIDGRMAAMMLLNVLGDTSGMNPLLEPPEQAGAVRLIKQAGHSVFVRELAVADWARGRGLARSLLGLAEGLSRSHGLGRVTLIVNDSNGPAHRLYLKEGFVLSDGEPSVGHPAFADGSMLLLMEKRTQQAE